MGTGEVVARAEGQGIDEKEQREEEEEKNSSNSSNSSRSSTLPEQEGTGRWSRRRFG